MKRYVRSGSGLGDSLYLRAVCEQFEGRVIALTNYPDIFIGSRIQVEPFRTHQVTVRAHYTGGKANPKTNQWQDILEAAGLPLDVSLRFDWTVQNNALVERVRGVAQGRKVVLLHGGRPPMNRPDGFGRELLPQRRGFDLVQAAMSDCLFVRVGHGQEIYKLESGLDLWGKTTVADLLDLAFSSDGILGPCSFCIPLAEALDKPLLCVWAHRGLSASHDYIRTITPRKILASPKDRWIYDDATEEKVREVALAFRHSL